MGKKYNKLKDLRIDEMSGVDSPAQKGAKALIMKRDGAATLVLKQGVLLSDVEGHSHLLEDSAQAGETSWSKSEGEDYGHSHPYARTVEGTLQIGASNGHTHTVVAKRDATGTTEDINKENDMTTQTADQANIEKMAKLEADLAVAKALNAFNDAERAHYGTLDATAQGNFLKASPADRKVTLDAIALAKADSNPIVYTASTGETFRKNDDPRLVSMAKGNDELRARNAATELSAQTSRLEKRAGDELGNITGELPTKVALLKAIDGISDEGIRGKVGELLKSLSSGLAEAFVKRGTSAAPAATGQTGSQDANAKLADLAKRHADTHKVSVQKAYVAVLDTPEGQALYEQTVPKVG